jgi:hypothetical protein
MEGRLCSLHSAGIMLMLGRSAIKSQFFDGFQQFFAKIFRRSDPAGITRLCVGTNIDISWCQRAEKCRRVSNHLLFRIDSAARRLNFAVFSLFCHFFSLSLIKRRLCHYAFFSRKMADYANFLCRQNRSALRDEKLF